MVDLNELMPDPTPVSLEVEEVEDERPDEEVVDNEFQARLEELEKTFAAKEAESAKQIAELQGRLEGVQQYSQSAIQQVEERQAYQPPSVEAAPAPKPEPEVDWESTDPSEGVKRLIQHQVEEQAAIHQQQLESLRMETAQALQAQELEYRRQQEEAYTRNQQQVTFNQQLERSYMEATKAFPLLNRNDQTPAGLAAKKAWKAEWREATTRDPILRQSVTTPELVTSRWAAKQTQEYVLDGGVPATSPRAMAAMHSGGLSSPVPGGSNQFDKFAMDQFGLSEEEFYGKPQ